MQEETTLLSPKKSHLEKHNQDLRFRLSVADDELEHLRFRNLALAKHREKLEKTATYLYQTEAELCEIRNLLGDEQGMSKQRENMIQIFENVNYTLKHQNEKLTDKLDNLRAQMEQDKFNLHTMKTALQNLQYEMEETQLELQHKENVICQKNQVLKQLEESTEECSNFLTDLRLKNQELKEQLKDREEKTLHADMSDTDGSCQPLTLAEEIQLLTASDGEDSVIEEPKPKTQPVVREPERHNRCTGCQTSRFLRLALLLLCLLILISVLIRGVSVGNCGCLFLETLWRRVAFLIEPYCTIYYNSAPPI